LSTALAIVPFLALHIFTTTSIQPSPTTHNASSSYTKPFVETYFLFFNVNLPFYPKDLTIMEFKKLV
jgi:hypothetical protein